MSAKGEENRTTNCIIRSSDVHDDDPTTFKEMCLKPEILRGLEHHEYYNPSPIQRAAIPTALLGADLIAQAKSGTGKTCVFATSVLQQIDLKNYCVQALVLAPTREIAVQIRDVFREIGMYLKGLEVHVFIGGISTKADANILKLGCHVAVGTPGRINDLMQRDYLKTIGMDMIVLDEADQLFQESFEQTLLQIFEMCPRKKQLMAFTATLLNDIEEKISTHMQDPQLILIDQDKPSLKFVKQFYKEVSVTSKKESEKEDGGSSTMQSHELLRLKVDALLDLLTTTPFNQCVVFSNNKRRAQDISETLTSNGWPAQCIHGSQEQTQRLLVFERLRKFKIRILVSSDLVSRGVDIERLSLVVNLDLPYDAETYMHRVGRTGRFGTKGVAVTFIFPTEKLKLDAITKTLNAEIDILPAEIDKKLFNLWLRDGEKEALEKFEQKRLQKEKENRTELREPTELQKNAPIKRSPKKKRTPKKNSDYELKENKFITGERVLAKYKGCWTEAIVIEMVKKNNFVRFTWQDFPDEGRFLREVENVMKKEKPKQVAVQGIYLASYENDFYVCRVQNILEGGKEVDVEWRDFDDSAIIPVTDLLVSNYVPKDSSDIAPEEIEQMVEKEKVEENEDNELEKKLESELKNIVFTPEIIPILPSDEVDDEFLNELDSKLMHNISFTPQNDSETQDLDTTKVFDVKRDPAKTAVKSYNFDSLDHTQLTPQECCSFGNNKQVKMIYLQKSSWRTIQESDGEVTLPTKRVQKSKKNEKTINLTPRGFNSQQEKENTTMVKNKDGRFLKNEEIDLLTMSNHPNTQKRFQEDLEMENMFNQINSLDVKTSSSILDNINATATDSGVPFVIDSNTFAHTAAAVVDPNLATANIVIKQKQGIHDANNFHSQTQTTTQIDHNRHPHQSSGGDAVDLPLNNTTSASIPVQTTSVEGNIGTENPHSTYMLPGSFPSSKQIPSSYYGQMYNHSYYHPHPPRHHPHPPHHHPHPPHHHPPPPHYHPHPPPPHYHHHPPHHHHHPPHHHQAPPSPQGYYTTTFPRLLHRPGQYYPPTPSSLPPPPQFPDVVEVSRASEQAAHWYRDWINS